MSVYERNGYWYAEVPLSNGKKLKRSVGKKGIVTKSMARQVEQELKRKVKLGQWDMVQDIPTFNDFIPEFISYIKDIKQNRAWQDASDCVESFARFFGNKKLLEINYADIEDYKRVRTQESRKPATINKELAFVRHLFNYAKRCKKFYGDNPVSVCGLLSVNNQKTRIITPEEEALLIANAEEPLKSMIQMALFTSLRLNSIRTLKWNCVELTNGTITIEAFYSKNKRNHILPISNKVRKLLLEAKLKCGGSEYVFPEAMALTRKGITLKFRMLCKKLGIQGVRFHDLRHTAATRMVESGVGIDKVSKILGHSTLQMTMRYSHPDNSLREAVEALANFTSKATNSATSDDLIESN
ncbi:MAG: tyrosine-type recombinase/integrase [Ignavibacteriales bacterium]